MKLITRLLVSNQDDQLSMELMHQECFHVQEFVTWLYPCHEAHSNILTTMRGIQGSNHALVIVQYKIMYSRQLHRCSMIEIQLQNITHYKMSR